MSSVIEVDNLGKKYIIAHEKSERYTALRDVVADKVKSYGRKIIHSLSGNSNITEPTREQIWALQDISFEIKQGDRVGIIGRNGAGKSTLLKVLSRITAPTTGRVRIKGRVASLLEVGTGFHPELTGRENIYLNGAILGMSKTEISNKFDEIAAFAEVEKFLDTPVKRYSSGMYMRLAFAVAAHMDTEILLIDEVLAVGDSEFQRKCLGKMGDLSASDKTILFVSHNLAAVQRLCQKGIYLENGKVKLQGNVSEVLEVYHRSLYCDSDKDGGIKTVEGRAGFIKWRLRDSTTGLPYSCFSREQCEFEFVIVSKQQLSGIYLGCAIWSSNDELIFCASSMDNGEGYLDLPIGYSEAIFKVRLPIKAGTYRLDVSLNSLEHGQIDRWQANPKLIVLPVQDTTMPEVWHGILNESAEFQFRPIADPLSLSFKR